MAVTRERVTHQGGQRSDQFQSVPDSLQSQASFSPLPQRRTSRSMAGIIYWQSPAGDRRLEAQRAFYQGKRSDRLIEKFGEDPKAGLSQLRQQGQTKEQIARSLGMVLATFSKALEENQIELESLPRKGKGVVNREDKAVFERAKASGLLEVLSQSDRAILEARFDNGESLAAVRDSKMAIRPKTRWGIRKAEKRALVRLEGQLKSR